jgi:peptidoglycan-N-acetylglucosamine deacetylase
VRRILISFLLVLAAAPALAATPKRIAITFDDAPRGDTHFPGSERAQRLLGELKSVGVQAAFFCSTAALDAEGRERIETYRAAGHLVANHAYAHPDLHRVGADAFIADFARAAKGLESFPDARKWFRFPYLHEGRTAQERDAVRKAIAAAGYAQGYVTVDNYDWYMDRLFQEAVAAGREVDHARLRDAYVQILVDGAEFYDGIARKALGRSPVHVLLLHENDLAALFVADLVGALNAKGWEVVSADEAYADPIAKQEPRTLQLGQGRVVALAVDRGYKGRKASIWEDEAKIRKEFARRKVWK